MFTSQKKKKKNNIKTKKTQATSYKKIPANHIHDEELVSRKYIFFKLLKFIKTNNPIKKWARDLKSYVTKKDTGMANNLMKS